MTLDEILVDDIVLRRHKLGAARLGELRLDLQHLGFDDLLDLSLVCENALQLLDRLVELGQTLLDLLTLHAGKAAQRHVDDRLRLYIGKTKAGHQVHLGIADRCAGADDVDDFINVVDGDLVALEDMRLALCLFEIKGDAAGDDLFLMIDVML